MIPNESIENKNELRRLNAVADGAIAPEDAALKTASPEVDDKRPKQKDQLLEIIEKIECWHDSDQETCVSIPLRTHLENTTVRSRRFKAYLSGTYAERFNGAPSSAAIEETLRVVEARGYNGKEYETHIRVAAFGGDVWIDLADTERRAVRCSSTGWEVTSNARCPIKFMRPNTFSSLPMPVRSDSNQRAQVIAQFFKLLNISDQRSRILILGFLSSCLNPAGPFFILSLRAEQGSGKSTASRIIRSVIDPNKVPLSSPPRTEEDLLVDAESNYIVAHDNQSSIKDEMSDARCRLATGGGLKKRKLFSDKELVSVTAKRPQIDNSIEDGAPREDLRDRTIFTHLEPLTSETRLTEESLMGTFEKIHPAMLGIMLDAVCEALRRKGTVHLVHKPRMLDAAVWATASEPALGLPDGAFVQALIESQRASTAEYLESSPIAQGLFSLLATFGNEVTKTASELLELIPCPPGYPHWPRTARGMSNALTRISPALRNVGIEVEGPRTARTSEGRYWHFRKRQNSAAPSVDEPQSIADRSA